MIGPNDYDEHPPKRGRPEKLTAEQQANLVERYQLWLASLAHRPRALCEEFGINLTTLRRYLRKE